MNQTSDGKKETPYLLRRKDIMGKILLSRLRFLVNYKHIRRLRKRTLTDCLSIGTYLEENAEKYPDKTALLYEDMRFTHQEFNEWVNRYANYFLCLGLKKGDSVNVFLENRPEMMVIIGALAKIGAIASLLNPNQRGKVLLHSIKITPSRILIIGEELIDAFEEIKPDLALLSENEVYFLSDRGQRSTPAGYLDLGEEIKDSPVSNPLTTRDVMLKDPFAYIFTSGTTGLPKAAILIQARWVGGGMWFGTLHLKLKPKDTMYICLPFNHSNALTVGWAPAAAGGAAVALRRRFSASNFWKDTRKFNATSFVYIGELPRYLMNQPPQPDDRDNPVKKIVGNGLRPDIWKDFKERFGILKVYEFYGATETSLVFTNSLNLDCTIGRCSSPHAIVKYDIDADEPVRDENGFFQRVSPGETGLLLAEITETAPFVGYTDKEATEKKIIRDAFLKGDAWFNSGDLLRDIGFNHAQFVDRLGDTFRWKGENVSTTEVENVVNAFEQVTESTAYGVSLPGTDGRAGMVSLIAHTTAKVFDFKGLLTTLSKNLPPYAIPVFVRFHAQFETTSTFKYQKSDLKKAGFDPHKVADPLYVRMPGSPDYVPLTAELFKKIQEGEYRF